VRLLNINCLFLPKSRLDLLPHVIDELGFDINFKLFQLFREEGYKVIFVEKRYHNYLSKRESVTLKHPVKTFIFDNAEKKKIINISNVTNKFVILLSSGSTNSPKLILRTWTSVDEEATRSLEKLGIRPSSSTFTVNWLICATSICHAYNFNTVLIAYYGQLNLMLCLSPRLILKKQTKFLLSSQKAEHNLVPSYNILFASPPFYQKLIEIHQEKYKPRWRVNFCLSAGSPTSLLLSLKFKTLYSTIIHNDYGITETGTIFTCSPKYTCSCHLLVVESNMMKDNFEMTSLSFQIIRNFKHIGPLNCPFYPFYVVPVNFHPSHTNLPFFICPTYLSSSNFAKLSSSFESGELLVKKMAWMSSGYISKGKVYYIGDHVMLSKAEYKKVQKINNLDSSKNVEVYKTGDIVWYDNKHNELYFCYRSRPSALIKSCVDGSLVGCSATDIERIYDLFFAQFLGTTSDNRVSSKSNNTSQYSDISVDFTVTVTSNGTNNTSITLHLSLLEEFSRKLALEEQDGSNLERFLVSEMHKTFKNGLNNDFCCSQCCKQLLPTKITFYEEGLPKSAAGKVLYPLLSQS
jgi:acyl-CoA synthetase (AMP-forming)/AMP-acid ligase II